MQFAAGLCGVALQLAEEFHMCYVETSAKQSRNTNEVREYSELNTACDLHLYTE